MPHTPSPTPDPEASTPVDGEALREAMRLAPSPVTVVTVGGAVEQRGITIGSFASTSLDPPLISFNVGLDAQMHDVLAQAPHFAVHLLGEDQAFLSDHFAVPDRSGAEQFEGLAHALTEAGVPVLPGAVCVLHCVPYARYAAGDHSIFVGEVVRIDAGVAEAPLLYFDRGYRRVGSDAPSMETTSSRLAPVKRASNESS